MKTPRARALTAALRGWLAENPTWHLARTETGWGVRQRRPEEIAPDLIPVLEGMDVRLATVLESPNGELVRQVVGWVLPPGSGLLFSLLVDSVILAAQAQNKNDTVRALVLGSVLLLAGLFVSSLRKELASQDR